MEREINILIVEDEILVAMDIKATIEDMGFRVQAIATNYDETMQVVNDFDIDMVLMDINLEGSQYDGIDTALKIEAPVIFVTAFCDEKTIERAVQCEPLGYIVKPFNESDLKANLILAKHKLEKNRKKQNGSIELGGGYCYNTKLDEVFYDDIPLNLGINEKKLFKLLFYAKDSIVSFNDIELEVWGSAIVNESTRRSLIFRLKSKLDHKFIETISGLGCKMSFNS